MGIDIPLAGWLLSVATFVLGTITPFLYRRFSHEGIAIQQAYDVRATTQDETEKSQGEVVVSTIVKLANAQKETVLLDGIEVSFLKTDGTEFEPSNVELKVYEPKTEIHLPPHTAPDRLLDYLPLLVKSDEERIIAMGFRFQHSPKDDADAVFKLSRYIERQGLRVAFRINGKYRNYVMTVKRPD
jgi:hypothetical protein